MKRFLALMLSFLLVFGAAESAPHVQAAGKKLIAITFDDGPGPYTNRLLDGLKSRNVKATFFMVGSNVKGYPEIVSRVYQEGHQVANHSYSHSDLTTLSDSGVRSQIQNTNALLDKACGKGTSYMIRAPYGEANARVRSVAGAPFVYWSVDPQDWLYRDASTVKNRVVNNARDGAIVLLHDIHSTSVDGALAAIDILKNKGYEFVTVRELFRRRGVEMKNGTQYYSCEPTGKDLGPVSAPTVTSEKVDGKLRITLSAQSGASIYYSTNGSALNQKSLRYTGPFTVSSPCTIRAVAAYNMNGSRSAEIRQTITRPVARKPELQVMDGVLTLTCPNKDAQIFYTLDGSKAGENSQLYTEPVLLEPGTVVSACAGGGDYLTSGVVQGTYSEAGNFFRDVFPYNWFYKEMDWAASAGYIQGVGSDTYQPKGQVTRAQLVTLLYRYAGGQAAEEDRANCMFTDVKQGKYYTDAVVWANARGIVNGYPDKTFRPNRKVTRQEMSEILAKYLSSQGYILPEGAGAADHYTDRGRISAWALSSVEKTSACGLLLGDDNGAFRPKDNAVRAQAAVILMRLKAVEGELPKETQEPEGTPGLPEESEVPEVPEASDGGEAPAEPEGVDGAESSVMYETPNVVEEPEGAVLTDR